MKITDHRNEIISKARLFINTIETNIYILGTNIYGLNVARWLKSNQFKIGGFINDFVDYSKFHEFDIFKLHEVPYDSTIINCIIEGRVIVAEQNIVKHKPHSHIDYFALQLAFPEYLEEVTFLDDTESIGKNLEHYLELYDRLSDPESKNVLENLCNFRLNRDISYLKSFKFSPSEQYFEPFLQIDKNPSFIDGGGYDGETSETFAKIYSKYKNIYFFEPNESEYLKAKHRLHKHSNIHFYKKGLWNNADTLIFDNSLAGASKLSKNGNITIETVALDEIINTKIDLIKLDIEGAEFNALLGAKKIIKDFKPNLAICVYHNQSDFIRIPELILSYCDEYKIYLRHYTQGVFESVMYFI